jgi:hypothetical protein
MMAYCSRVGVHDLAFDMFIGAWMCRIAAAEQIDPVGGCGFACRQPFGGTGWASSFPDLAIFFSCGASAQGSYHDKTSGRSSRRWINASQSLPVWAG